MADGSDAPKGNDGLVNLTPDVKDPIVDIVFVHGLTGNRMATWTKSTIMWPRDILAKDKDMKKARIFTWGYDSDIVHFWSKTAQEDIDAYARNLCADLGGYRDMDGTKDRPIIFVMHSLGGLVCKEALLLGNVHPEDVVRSIGESTRGMLFLGTPHAGSSLANWANVGLSFAKIFKRLNNRNVKILQENSVKLADIGEKFPLLLNTRAAKPETKIEVACFYEELPTDVGIIVPEASATLQGYRKQSIPQDHIDMCKYTHEEDIGYKRVSEVLAGWIKALASPSQKKLGEGTTITGTISGPNFGGQQTGVQMGGINEQHGFTYNVSAYVDSCGPVRSCLQDVNEAKS